MRPRSGWAHKGCGKASGNATPSKLKRGNAMAAKAKLAKKAKVAKKKAKLAPKAGVASKAGLAKKAG